MPRPPRGTLQALVRPLVLHSICYEATTGTHALKGVLVSHELVDLPQALVERLGLGIQPLEGVQMHVQHLNHLRQLLRGAPSRLGLAPFIEELDSGGEGFAHLP